DLVERVLKALAPSFTDDKVALDTGNFNAARITKLYGTVAAKGDDTQQRPHRLSAILEDPGLRPGEIVTEQQLQELAALLPEEPARASGSNTHRREFDLESWIREHNPPVRGPYPYLGTHRLWRGEHGKNCPFSDNHNNVGFFLIQFATGAISAGCHHNSCQGKHWKEFRLLFEPDAYSQSDQTKEDR